MVPHPRKLGECTGLDLGGNPPVPIAQDRDEVGSTPIDLAKAQGDDSPGLGVLASDAPAQVHEGELDVALGAELTQLRIGVFYKLFALFAHVLECRGHKDAHACTSRDAGVAD